MPFNIPSRKLYVICLSLALPLPAWSESYDATHNPQWSQELEEIIEEQEALAQQTSPDLQGWFVQERKALLATNAQLTKLLLEQRKALIEVKIALTDTQTQLLTFVRALTWLAWISCGAIVILGALYAWKHLT